jgi:hypothetical protein
VTAHCATAGAPAERTMRRWCHSFADQAPAWLAEAQATLAEQDPATPLLDPLGPAAGPVPAPQALLAATWHTAPAVGAGVCWPGPRPAGRNWRATAPRIGWRSCGSGGTATAWPGWFDPQTLRTAPSGRRAVSWWASR